MKLEINQILQNIKNGKKIEKNKFYLSFLKKDHNKLLLEYINRKLKKKYYTEKLNSKEQELNNLIKAMRDGDADNKIKEKIERIEESLVVIREKYDKYKHIGLGDSGRQKIHRIKSIINKKYGDYLVFNKNKDEFNLIKGIQDFLKSK